MDKTLHRKLTEKYYSSYTQTLVYNDASNEMLTCLSAEMDILKSAAKDLLQPRPQAVSRLLQMAKDI